MKYLFLLLPFISFSQTFNAIPYNSPDIIAPGRGAEHWNNVVWDEAHSPFVPAGNKNGLNEYYRFNWTDIETSRQDVYNWSVFDKQINAAIDAGRSFSFGIMSICSACGPGGTYPAYLHQLMQSESANNKDWNYKDLWIPNWNSPNYLGRWEALLHAVATHILTGTHNGKKYRDAIYYIDIRGYGDFGEWHTYPWTGTEPAGRQASPASLIRIINAHLNAFPAYPLVIPMGAYDGGHASRIPPQVSYYALVASNTWGQVGWRRDNYGDAGYNSWLTSNQGSYNNQVFARLIMNKWKYAIVGGEPANDINAISRDCGSPHCDLEREIRLFHTSSFGNGNYPGAAFNNSMRENVRAASKASGYRLLIKEAKVSPVATGLSISLHWQNTGVAPVYQHWNVLYELRNSQNKVVWSGNSYFKPRLFLPSNTDSIVTDVFTKLPSGIYQLVLQVKDPSGYKKPLPLAITGRAADGSYAIRTVTVGQIKNEPPKTQAMVHLVVIQGESNAGGIASNAAATTREKAAHAAVQIFNSNTKIFENLVIGVNNNLNQFVDPATMHGMELGLANEVEAGNLPGPVYLVKLGASGSYISQWLPGSTRGLWEMYMPYLDAAIAILKAKGIPFKITVWQSIGLNDRYKQGTSPADFMKMMTQFRDAFRKRYGNGIRFLSTDFNNPPAQTYEWTNLFKQMAAADKLFIPVSVKGATYLDGSVHFDYKGMKLLAHNMVTLMK